MCEDIWYPHIPSLVPFVNLLKCYFAMALSEHCNSYKTHCDHYKPCASDITTAFHLLSAIFVPHLFNALQNVKKVLWITRQLMLKWYHHAQGLLALSHSVEQFSITIFTRCYSRSAHFGTKQEQD